MTYDHFEHRHRFSAWAASRAASRGAKGATSSVLSKTLIDSGVKDFLKAEEKHATVTEESFTKLHKKWCSAAEKSLRDQYIEGIEYGRIAKLIAIYIKSMIVNGPGHTSALADVAHPPIDSFLLKELAKRKDITDQATKKLWRNVTWTTLKHFEYYALIETLKALDDAKPFWMLEKYWPEVRP
ncbi:hypothetical protein [Pseudomonas sp. D2002]|uniref:hypothetical protein n=1 Tax=Pseudomonas sp. D2002 TaxID=2726980 RepID=UPI0015A265CD|nr:hypothetical protein [Pseudomonas sp. D2002]NWA81618.1 hypothetical protein [Pseudomonas sp. D2002]